MSSPNVFFPNPNASFLASRIFVSSPNVFFPNPNASFLASRIFVSSYESFAFGNLRSIRLEDQSLPSRFSSLLLGSDLSLLIA